MKTLGESKLLLVMGLIVLLGGGALFGLRALQNAQEQPVPAPTPPGGWTQARFDALVKDARNVLDKPGATVTVVEFADFQCPSCRRAYNGNKGEQNGAGPVQLVEKAPTVRYVFRHFPLTNMHERAMPAAVASEAAAKQDKFWPMYDALFKGGKLELSDTFLDQCAKKAGLDMDKFHKDQADNSLVDLIKADQKIGLDNNVGSTPTFVVRTSDGKIYQAVGGTEFDELMKNLKILKP